MNQTYARAAGALAFLSALTSASTAACASTLPAVFDGSTIRVSSSFTWSNDALIDGQAWLETDPTVVLRLTGQLSNATGSSAGISKTGSGTLSLEGPNTYSGNTVVYQGGLHVAGTQAAGSSFRTVELHAGTQLDYAPGASLANALQLHGVSGSASASLEDTLAQSVRLRVDQGVATQAGNIFGSVLLIKQGQGILRLERMAATPAAARIEAGTLEVNSLFGGTIQVLNNAQLAGVGAVAQVQIRTGATLTPGPTQAAAGSAQAIGELTVTGNLHMQANSALHADVLPDGRSDHLRVLGLATVNGHVLARALEGPWQPETRYTLVSADGGLNGRFATASSSLPFLQPSLSYDAGHAYLTLTRNTTALDSVIDNPGQNDIGDAVDDLTDGATAPIRDAVITQNRPGARQLLAALSGSWIPSVASRLLEDSRYIRDAALRRMRRQKEPATGLWASSYGAVAKRDGDDSLAPDKRKLAGVAMGRVITLGSGTRTSLFAGYEHSAMGRSGTQTTTQANSLHAGVAVAGQAGWLDVSLGVIRSWHRLQGQREILSQRLKQWLSSRYRMHALQVFGEAAVPLLASTGENARSGPLLQGFSRLAWVHMKTPEHQEHGGTAALSFETQRMRTLFSELGLRARYAWRRANRVSQVHAELAWHHAAGTLAARTQARFARAQAQRHFAVEGQAVARNALDINLTLETVVGRRMHAALAYTGRLAKGSRDHGATLDVTWAF